MMKFSKTLLAAIFFTTVLFFHFPLLASGQKLVNGAGTIPGGSTALSLDLGLEIPEPVFYGLRADFGLGDRVQLGVGGSFLVAANTFGIFSLFNVAQSKDESHFLSLYLNPSILHLSNIFVDEDPGTTHIMVFLLNPGMAYEHRFGSEKKSGVYLKLGTIHLIGISGGGEFFAGGFGPNTTLLQITPGFQHNFNTFSLTLQPISYIYLGNNGSRGTLDRFSFGAKVGLSWIF